MKRLSLIILFFTITNLYSDELYFRYSHYNNISNDSLELELEKNQYPKFLTKEYFYLDKKNIVSNNDNINKLYKISSSNIQENQLLFDGLESSGSISRGFNIGNNQNSVLNSELDLQISGKLSEKIYLKASIQDANIPLQDNGYSQRLDEFDQIFIELISDDWRIRAGDIDLKNSNSYFGKFEKRIQGLNFSVNPNNQVNIYGST